jgi:putative thiamine transport system permease protein
MGAPVSRRMSRPLQDSASLRRPSWLLGAPLLLLAIALVPVLAGLAGTVGPAASAAAWQALFATPGLGRSLALSFSSGVVAALLSLLLAHGLLAALTTPQAIARARALALPLIAMPHLALAIGVALVLAPSGLLLRLVSPWLTGFEQPPDWTTIQDPLGLALIAGLVLKETPFLLLALSAALAQVPADRLLLQARTLGYGRLRAWALCVAPALQRQIALPFAAVVVFGISNVDVALALGPTTPPTFAMLLWEWFLDPDLARRPLAAAGALLLMGLCIGVLALLWGLAGGAERWRRASAIRGWRAAADAGMQRLLRGTGLVFALLGALALLALWLRSIAPAWRFPRLWPSEPGLAAWREASALLGDALPVTAALATASTALAVALALAAAEALRNRPRQRAALAALLFVPLLVPQFSFLFGLQVLLAKLRLDGSWPAVVWSHLVYVLPYVFGVVATARAALEPRWRDVALTLGATPSQAYWRVTLPLLARSLLLAAALGFSVSVAVYLPTLFAGAGRFATLATEAAATIAAGNLRAAAVAAATMASLPLAVLALAVLASTLLFRNRRDLPS